jgi:hypothetical protein
MTIESQKIHDYVDQASTLKGGAEGSNSSTSDLQFMKINEQLEKKHLMNKIMILKQYVSIYQHQPELLKNPRSSLSPLS